MNPSNIIALLIAFCANLTSASFRSGREFQVVNYSLHWSRREAKKLVEMGSSEAVRACEDYLRQVRQIAKGLRTEDPDAQLLNGSTIRQELAKAEEHVKIWEQAVIDAKAAAAKNSLGSVSWIVMALCVTAIGLGIYCCVQRRSTVG
jgi:hypothetical protein